MKKVLLASAAKVFLRRNTDLLQKRGFQLFSVTTGSDALRLHKELVFDLIIADLKLEDVSGCTFCNLIRELPANGDVPIILVCHNLPDSLERVRQSGADAVLVKPINPIELLERVSSFIDLPIDRSRRVVLNVNVMSRALGLEFICNSRDISTTGILLETDYELGLGSQVFCRFQLPGSSLVEAEGEIIRMLCSADGATLYGIKFSNLSLSHARAITDYVSSVVHQQISALT